MHSYEAQDWAPPLNEATTAATAKHHGRIHDSASSNKVNRPGIAGDSIL